MGCLRLLLALAVVDSHSQNLMPGIAGGEAVQLFFVISGFYMALILEKKYHRAPLFYSNRLLRLYPSYALVLVASIAWFLLDWAYIHHRPPPLWIADADRQMQWWQWTALQFSNLTMLGLDIPSLFHWKAGEGFLFMHFRADAAPDGAQWMGWYPWVRQAWSIGSEIWFYLSIPFIVRWRPSAQIGLAILSCALMIYLGRFWPLTGFFFPANLWLFLSGALLFKCYRARPNWLTLIPGELALLYILVAGVLVGLVENSMMHVAILASIAITIPILFQAFGSRQWDQRIGELSYPVYLVHLLVIGVLAASLHLQSELLDVPVTLAVSYLLVRFIETPVDAYRQRRVSDAATVAAETSLANSHLTTGL